MMICFFFIGHIQWGWWWLMQKHAHMCSTEVLTFANTFKEEEQNEKVLAKRLRLVPKTFCKSFLSLLLLSIVWYENVLFWRQTMATSLSTGRTGPLKWGSDHIIPQTLKKKKTSAFKLSDYQTICQIIRSYFRLSNYQIRFYRIILFFKHLLI